MCATVDLEKCSAQVDGDEVFYKSSHKKILLNIFDIKESVKWLIIKVSLLS